MAGDRLSGALPPALHHRKIKMKFLSVLLLCLSLLPAHAARVETGDERLDGIFEALTGSDFAAKEDAISALAATGHAQRFEWIEGVLDGRLRLLKKQKRLVWAEQQGSRYVATDALSGEMLGEFKKRKLKKIAINNALRRGIRGILATRDLDSEDPAARLSSIQAMLANPSPGQAQLVEPRLASEADPEVRSAMQLVLALGKLGAQAREERLQAITDVSASLEPAVRQQLQKMTDSDPDAGVRAAAARSLEKIEERVKLFGHLETLFFGLSLGSVLVLAAIGLAITFGVMGVINMAHGELIMLGAYTTYMMQLLLPEHTGLSLLLSIPAAFIVSGLAGIAIERGVIRFLYGRPLETLLATFGISLILQQLVRTLISPQNVPVSNPEFMSGFWQVNSVLSLTYNRLYIILFCLLVFAGLFLILKRTRLGLQVRAVSQNRSMARAMGVHSARVDALTFGLGSGIAGVAGVALSQLTNVGPNLGQAYIVDSFMVVVFGGVGNLWGTLIGGIGLGVANKFMEPWAGAVMAKILILVLVILFIQKRPRGLFPQKGRAAEG